MDFGFDCTKLSSKLLFHFLKLVTLCFPVISFFGKRGENLAKSHAEAITHLFDKIGNYGLIAPAFRPLNRESCVCYFLQTGL